MIQNRRRVLYLDRKQRGGCRVENGDPIYVELQKHLDRQAVGFPATRSGVELRILRELFTPEQAGVALHLGIEPKSVAEVHEEMRASGITVERVARLLIEMLKNGAITAKIEDGNHYCPVKCRIDSTGYRHCSLKTCNNHQKTGFLRVFSQKA